MIKSGANLKVIESDWKAFHKFKRSIPDESVIEAEFRSITVTATDKAFRFFHALRDACASTLGYDREYAKNELCCMFGIVLEAEEDITEPAWSSHCVSGYSVDRESFCVSSRKLRCTHEKGNGK